MGSSKIGRVALAALDLAGLLGASLGVRAETATSHQTIVFMRHGEKPEQGLGQLNCQGLNRALALPAVLQAKFGRPAAIFAPDPSKRKDDAGKSYDYIRPLVTIEPTAIKLGMPVDTTYGFADIAMLKDALEQPSLHDATVFVAWEHKIIVLLAKQIIKAHGGDDAIVPKWHGSDFDSLYIVKLAWTGPSATVSFEQSHEGLDGRPMTCPN